MTYPGHEGGEDQHELSLVPAMPERTRIMLAQSRGGILRSTYVSQSQNRKGKGVGGGTLFPGRDGRVHLLLPRDIALTQERGNQSVNLAVVAEFLEATVDSVTQPPHQGLVPRPTQGLKVSLCTTGMCSTGVPVGAT